MADKTESSRADAVRARREKRSRRDKIRPVSAPTGPAGKTAHDAPILMRGVNADVPVTRKTYSPLRRRYDISLGSPGAEMRLPAVPFLRPSWRWLSGLFASSLIVLLGVMWNHPAFLVEAIEIQGLQRLEAREVYRVLGVQGAPVFTLDPALLEHDLGLAFPEFLSIDVRVGLPNAVSITVEEREPVLGWMNAQGMVLVDRDGVSFPARGLVSGNGEDSVPLPVIHAPDLVMALPPAEEAPQMVNPYVGRQLLSAEQVAALLVMSGAAPANATLLFDPRHGMGWEDPAGWVVFFGLDGDDMGARLQAYDSVAADLERKKVTPDFISVEYIHAPYYRMER